MRRHNRNTNADSEEDAAPGSTSTEADTRSSLESTEESSTEPVQTQASTTISSSLKTDKKQPTSPVKHSSKPHNANYSNFTDLLSDSVSFACTCDPSAVNGPTY